MSKDKKTVCIVGAGESGLAALKECVQHGMAPTLYDLDSDIGGLWHKKPAGQYSNTASIWPTLVTNTSKYTTCFSDFPPDPKDPVFISPPVRETPDHEETGKWEVYTRESSAIGDKLSSQEDISEQDMLASCCKEIFDNVILCSGWFKEPFYPDIPGLKYFTGSVSHSFTYSDPRPFDNKKVLVVGNRISAAEISSDISNLAEETYLALGQGTWIIPRLFRGGVPLDFSIPRSMIWSRDPEFSFNEMILTESNGKMNHTQSGVGTSTLPATSPICISDDLPVKIASGKIKPYGHLTELKQNTAIFQEGETIPDLDAIVFCTGYRTNTSFVDLKIHDDDGKMELYFMVFPLNRKHNTLALVGHYGTDGSVVLLGENQARLAASVMSGRHQLPPQKTMAQNVLFWNQISAARRPGFYNYLIPGFAFMDALAMELGFYPSFWKIFFRDPVLAWRTWYGPYLAVQYRLLGPNSQWDKAREMCYKAYDEGLSCIRHADEKVADRPDIKRRRKQRAISVLGLGALVTGLILWRARK
ncbi:dimethylaniline monooxygenase [n-oxide-forming] [Plakobranchus ocellatus]|uniref:Flavin-containing monooxygenase n=1 Tax=Plakobranchus ocellatus TaxID=259542 RepID=A0AAV4ATH2_9GAST|nr:dimethylaniline monooxygenase [n-oxide-forming] [Plakobranchus ocellatus]